MFRNFLLLVLALAATSARAQITPAAPGPASIATKLATPTDTVRLSLPEAELRFTQNNLVLLAQQYNVTVAQAQAVQARLLDNPSIYVEQDFLRRKLSRPDVPDGTVGNEAIVTVQQLLRL